MRQFMANGGTPGNLLARCVFLATKALMPSFAYAALTHPGRRRKANQDAILINGQVHQRPWRGSGALGPGSLVAVADGVSTSPAPAEASRAVLEALRASFERAPQRPPRFHADAVHERICSGLTRARRGMASTLAAVVVQGPRVTAFNAGDSRIYLVSRGQARQLSKDHTALQGMLDRGEISPSQAAGAASFYQSLDNCFIADAFSEPPALSAREFEWQLGDALLLCSDGLTGVVDGGFIAATSGAPAERVEALFEAAIARGSEDDISILWLEARELARGAP